MSKKNIASVTSILVSIFTILSPVAFVVWTLASYDTQIKLIGQKVEDVQKQNDEQNAVLSRQNETLLRVEKLLSGCTKTLVSSAP